MNALTSRAPCARPNSLPPHTTPPFARRSSRERPLLRLPSSLLRRRLASETELSSSAALVFHQDILSSPVAEEASLLPSIRTRVVSLPALPSLSPRSCPTTPSPSPSSLLLRFRLPSHLRLPFFSGSVFPPVCLPTLPCPETPSRLPPLAVLLAGPLFSAFRPASVPLSSFRIQLHTRCLSRE